MSGNKHEIILKFPTSAGEGRQWRASDETLRNDLAEIIPLRRQSSMVLATLIASPGAVVSKNDLLEATWSNATASDENLGQCITDVRRALGDADHKIVRTHARRGYSVTVERPPLRPTDGRGCAFAVTVDFQASGAAAADQTAFEAAWMLEGALNDFSTLQVRRAETSASNTENADYRVLVRGGGGVDDSEAVRVRVVKSCTGDVVFNAAHLAPSAHDRGRTHIGVVAKGVEASIVENAARTATMSAPSTARDHYLLGTSLNPDTAACNMRARAAFDTALTLDEHDPLIWAGLAETHFADAFLEYSEDFSQSIDAALTHVQTAISLGPTASRPAWVSGRIFHLLGEWRLAEKAFDRAVALNPLDADAHAMRGSFLLHVGRAAEAVPALKRSIELNPERETRAYWALGAAYYSLSQFDLAIDALGEILVRRPSFHRPYRMVAASYAMMGQVERAHHVRESKLTDDPGTSLSAADAYLSRTMRRRRDVDLLLTGFDRAGFR